MTEEQDATEGQDAKVEVFFYGLFMDEALLRGKGLSPENPRVASVENLRLAIGRRATLVACEGCAVYGVLFTLTRAEVEALYSEESVRVYRSEVVNARTEDGVITRALCFNLPAQPSPEERNPQYASKLRELAARIGLPGDYVSSIM
jgi:hypothetical protein